VAGQLIRRGERTFLLRIYMGRDANGKRDYFNETVRGTKKEAQALLNKLLRDKDLGMLLEPSRESLDSYLDRWLEAAAKPRPGASSYGDYQWLLKRYVRPQLGTVPLQKLTALDIQKVYAAMRAQGLSSRTIQYTHRVLRSALEQAVKWRIIPQNPAQYAELPRQKRCEMQHMIHEESMRFLAAARTSPHFALFALMLATGPRPSEALALRWQDINPVRQVLRVTRTVKRVNRAWLFEEPKTKMSRRVVDYGTGLNEVLLTHQAGQAEIYGASGLVFRSLNGTPLLESNIRKRHFKPLLATAALPRDMRLYDLRHTHATLLLLEGVHPKIVSERLGHSSISITLDTYTHVIPSMQRESAEKIGKLLFGKQQDVGDRDALN
jgi:integrase